MSTKYEVQFKGGPDGTAWVRWYATNDKEKAERSFKRLLRYLGPEIAQSCGRLLVRP